MQVSIRKAQLADAGAIIAVLNPIIAAGSYTIMDEPLALEDQVAFMRNFPQRGVFYVAVDDDTQQIVGLQSVEPLAPTTRALSHIGDISTFVALDAQRSSVGRRLCQATFQAAQAQGFRKLMATVRADNPRAVAFYLSQGFRVIGTAQQHAFLGGNYIDEILMERCIVGN